MRFLSFSLFLFFFFNDTATTESYTYCPTLSLHDALPISLTDAAIAMFGALMGRAHLRARKRLEQGIAISGREGRDRLMRIATVLETVSRVARTGEDIGA